MLLENISEQQKEQIKTVVDTAGGIYQYAKKNDINRGHVSLAYNGKYLSPKMCELMGWGVSVTIPQSTLDGLKRDRDALKEEIEILDAVIERLHSNQIPPGTLPTEPCPIHGEVHCYNCQTEQVKPIESKPPINRKPPRTWPSYFKGSQTNIEQVARQLEKYWPDYEIIKKEK